MYMDSVVVVGAVDGVDGSGWTAQVDVATIKRPTCTKEALAVGWMTLWRVKPEKDQPSADEIPVAYLALETGVPPYMGAMFCSFSPRFRHF
jgi:hypothetical protein